MILGNVLVLTRDDFLNNTIPEDTKELYALLTTEANLAVMSADVVILGDKCVKNRFGTAHEA